MITIFFWKKYWAEHTKIAVSFFFLQWKILVVLLVQMPKVFSLSKNVLPSKIQLIWYSPSPKHPGGSSVGDLV